MCEARRAEYVRLLDEEGMNFTQAAHAVGVSKRTGKAWRNGRTRATGRNEMFCFNVCSTGSAVFFRSVG